MRGRGGATRGDATTSQRGEQEANERRRSRRTRDNGATREPTASTNNAMQAGGDNIYSTRGEQAAEQKLIQGVCGEGD